MDIQTYVETNISTHFYVTLQITHKKKYMYIYATHLSEMWKKRELLVFV